jgi:thioredoxin 1
MIKINESNFNEEVAGSDDLVVVAFSAVYCGPCKVLSPILDKLSEEVEGVKFAKADVQECLRLAQKMGIAAVPTVLFFKSGEVVGKMIGLKTEAQIRNKIGELKA